MKNFFKPLFIVCGLMAATTFTSCGDDTGLQNSGGDDENPPTITAYTLNVKADALNPVVKINSKASDLETVKVHFEGAETKMRRLYITQSLDGGEPVLYDVASSNIGVQLNSDDNSINLGDEAKKEFTYDIMFDAPVENNHTYSYQLWVTNGGWANTNSKGDIENPYYKNSYEEGAIGTIIINAGNGIGDVPVTEFATKISLFAPDSDGKTESFISILSGETSRITIQMKNSYEGTFTADEQKANAENVAYWDFGYYYTNGSGASFASASTYTSRFEWIDITKVSGLATSELNKFYFAKSSLVFGDIKQNLDLEGITQPNAEFIEQLAIGDVIEFVDGKSGAKGVIKVEAIKKGTGNNDYIKFSVKVQDLNFINL